MGNCKKSLPAIVMLSTLCMLLVYRGIYSSQITFMTRAYTFDDGMSLDGYLTFRGGVPLRLKCSTCSLVVGSGHMLGSAKGEEIDSRDCVIRTNTAPTTGYEKDVGTRTTVRALTRNTYRLVLKSLDDSRRLNLPLFDPDLPANSVLLKYGEQFYYENKRGLDQWPDLRLYIVQDKRYDQIIELFKPISTDPIRMSSGFITINYARDFCGEIHVYGMPESTVCDEVAKGNAKDVMYHYYEDSMGTECELYKYKLNAKNFGHHFLEEKKMFRQWMMNSTKLHFHAPEWPRR